MYILDRDMTAFFLSFLTPFSANRAGKASRPRPPTPRPHSSSNQSKAANISQSAKNVTFLLDNLLKDYDNSLRPDMGGRKMRERERDTRRDLLKIKGHIFGSKPWGEITFPNVEMCF